MSRAHLITSVFCPILPAGADLLLPYINGGVRDFPTVTGGIPAVGMAHIESEVHGSFMGAF
jgi:hypothetical protein